MDCLKIDEGMAIYQGEALSILRRLPMDSVDAVITDPPYSTGGMTLASRQADPASKYQSSGTKKTYPPMLGDTRDHLGDNVAFRMLAGSEGRCALAGFYRLAAITHNDGRHTGGGVDVARHRGLAQAECPTDDWRIPAGFGIHCIRQ